MRHEVDNRTRGSGVAAIAVCVLCLGGCSSGRTHGGFTLNEVGEVIGGVGLMLGVAAGLTAAQCAGGDPGNGSQYLFSQEQDWPLHQW